MRQQAVVTDPLRFELARHVRRHIRERGLPLTVARTGIAIGMKEIEAGRSLGVALASSYSAMRDAADFTTAPLTA